MDMPPSTVSVAPVTKELSSLAAGRLPGPSPARMTGNRPRE
jgi:hypothetical protein